VLCLVVVFLRISAVCGRGSCETVCWVCLPAVVCVSVHRRSSRF